MIHHRKGYHVVDPCVDKNERPLHSIKLKMKLQKNILSYAYVLYDLLLWIYFFFSYISVLLLVCCYVCWK